ncbi:MULTISPECIES: hypothetical protein [Rhodobacterales]|uniref:hypothetical protein n=1 Tax=Rhodobacterales TaxID=204455 RepID=UPI0011BF2B0A|nr:MULTISPECIES: hypothetical protein [Rhodobacterales]
MFSSASKAQSPRAQRPAPRVQTHALAPTANQSPQVQQLAALQTMANDHVAQRVKTVPQDYGDVSGSPVGMAIRSRLGGPRETWTADAIFNATQACYVENLVRGQALMAQLQQRKDDETPATTGDDNAALFADAYTTRVTPDQRGDHLYGIGTKGGDSHEIAYQNGYDVANASIETATNYAARDPNRAAEGPHLNNSEIFWNQWGAAVDADTPKSFFEFAGTHRARKEAKKRALGTITRMAVSNSSTILTVQHILPDNVSFSREEAVTETHAADTDAFAALLGTPNGRAIGFLLKDHYHEMDLKSFGDVKIDGAATSLTFNFAD